MIASKILDEWKNKFVSIEIKGRELTPTGILKSYDETGILLECPSGTDFDEGLFLWDKIECIRLNNYYNEEYKEYVD
jgi:hypothetical protein